MCIVVGNSKPERSVLYFNLSLYMSRHIREGLLTLYIALALSCIGCARGHHQVSLYPSSSDTTPSICPVDHPAMRISSPFGEVRSGGRCHKGIDLAVPQGTPVVATASGQTTFSGWQGAYGNIIIIRHGKDVETAYAHLKKCLTHQGDCVRSGQKIGLSGATGNATGPHLHYEIRKDGVPIDPRPWLP